MKSLLAIWLAVLTGVLPIARADTQKLEGWWRARVEHNGESSDFYLHFVSVEAGTTSARFSIPLVGTSEADLGPVRIDNAQVHITQVNWTLRLENGGTVLATEFPEWLVPLYRLTAVFHRSRVPTPQAPLRALEAAPVPSWTHQAGGAVWGGVAYDSSSDTVVVSAETGRTLALNGRSGAVIWSSEANAPVRSTPVIQGPDVYVVSDAKLLKLDSRSGQVRWTVELGAPLGERLPITDPKSRWDHYGSAASVSGGLVYVTSRDGCLYAFRAADGSSLWKSCTESLLTGTPAVALGRVVFGSFDGQVYAADASNGQALWKYNAVGAIPRDVVTVDQMAIIGSRSYDLLALDLATGRARWRNYFWYSWVDSVPTIRDSMLYIGSSDALKVFGLDVRTGKQRWACRMPGWAWAQPAVSPRTVYAGAVGSARAWAPRAGGFAAIDRSNGRLRWLLRSSPASGDQLLWGFAAAPAAAAGHVFAADLNGLVYAWTTPDEP